MEPNLFYDFRQISNAFSFLQAHLTEVKEGKQPARIVREEKDEITYYLSAFECFSDIYYYPHLKKYNCDIVVNVILPSSDVLAKQVNLKTFTEEAYENAIGKFLEYQKDVPVLTPREYSKKYANAEVSNAISIAQFDNEICTTFKPSQYHKQISCVLVYFENGHRYRLVAIP